MPTLTELTAADHGFTSINTDGYIAVIPAYQKFYVADGNAYNKIDFINTRITASVDPTDQGDDSWVQGEVCLQAEAGEGIFDEVYQSGESEYQVLIYRTNTTQFLTTTDITVSDKYTLENENISLVSPPPYWLPWVETSGSEGLLSDSEGPTSDIGCLYGGRIVLNNNLHPHQWFMSRQGDPLDWDTSQTDIGAAVSSQSSRAGIVGDVITALMPYHDYYMLFGCASSIYISRGNPMSGGPIANLSMTTGIFDPNAYCWDDKGNLYFLGSNGLYVLPPDMITDNVSPTNLLENRVPSLIKDSQINRRTDRASMRYDKQRQGILCTIVQKDGGWSVSFWYDLRTGGVFPEKYTDNAIPSSMMFYEHRRGDYRKLLFGGQDGYIREFNEDTKSDIDDDDTEVAINSYVTIGPININKETRGKSQIKETALKTGTDSDDVDYEIHAADEAQSLMENIESGAAPSASGTLTGGGFDKSIRDKVSGGAIGLKIGNNAADKTWSMEQLKLVVEPKGKL